MLYSKTETNELENMNEHNYLKIDYIDKEENKIIDDTNEKPLKEKSLIAKVLKHRRI